VTGQVATRPSRTSFPADPGSIAAARRFATGVVAPVHPGLCDAVSLMVSELATNAIRHGGTAFAVDVAALPGGVRVEVSDLGPAWQVTADPVPDDLGGRGLKIVDAMADSWGVVTARPHGGKTVWFELRQALGGVHPR
jgi:anti-sigma regulatory factor (Ser/Thr protein kinase)